MMEETVQLLPVHRKADFSCGNILLDRYFQSQVGQDIKKRVCTCFVIADQDNKVKGYYTLSSAAVSRISIPQEFQKKLPLYQNLPVTLLGRLAVDKKFHNKGLGEFLLIDALKRSYDAARVVIGSIAVIVDPIDDGAVNFYMRYGFIPLPDSAKMFLPMKTIAELF